MFVLEPEWDEMADQMDELGVRDILDVLDGALPLASRWGR